MSEKSDLEKLQDGKELLVLSTYEEGQFRYKKAVSALIIMLGVVLTASFNVAPIIITAMIGALLMILLQIIKPEEAYKAINWKVIFMLAGVLSMSTALEKTGGADLLGDAIFQLLQGFDARIILSAVFFITFVATNFMSNNASAALMAPIVISLAQSLQLSERPFLVAVMFAASLSFMTPVSYQTNTIIMTPGNYKFIDYVKVGTPLNLIMWIIATFVIPLYMSIINNS
jgi:di/tricarboxylate transporter